MTNEESKDILTEVKMMDDSIYQYNPKYLKALDMAITALEQTNCGKCEYLVCDEIFYEETGDEYDASYCRKQEPCEDCISRAEAIAKIKETAEWHTKDHFNADRVIRHLKGLPSVQPKAKVGHWIDGDRTRWECSNCGYGVLDWNNTPYCPNCGAKMKGEPK